MRTKELLYTSADGHCVYDDDGDFIAAVFDEGNSEHIVTCWNEHDSLKAKADLLDEVTDALAAIVDGYSSYNFLANKYEAGKLICNARDILSKAKELDK